MSSTTIDSLQIEINSNSGNASQGLQELTATLEKLKTVTKGGVGLTAVAKQLTAINTAVNGMGDASKLTGMLDALKNLSGVKISSTISTNINAIASSLNSLHINDDVGDKIKKLVDSLRPLSEMPKANLSSYITPLKSLPDVLTSLNGLDINSFKNKIKEVADALKPLATQMSKISSGFSSFPSKIKKVSSSMEKMPAGVNKASLSFVNFYHKLQMAIRAIKAVATAVAQCISKLNDYVENINLFNASMGEYAEEATEYMKKVNSLTGIDTSDWARAQGVFMTLATGFGVAGDRASLMSQQLTQLGYDISSFYNISVEDAMQKLQSGLSGELEPLRRLGYDLSQAKLEAIALSLGIDKSVKKMTQAEKAQLRYYAIMTQVTTAQGDLARTINTPANQLRILKMRFEQCARSIGSIFIPLLNAVLPYINAVVQLITELADKIAKFFGFEMPEIDYSGIESVAGEAEDATNGLEDAADAAKKLKNYTMGFDELNVIDPNSGGKDDGAGGGAFDFELPTYDFLKGLEDSKVSQIIEDIKKKWSESAIGKWAVSLDTSGVKTTFAGLVKETKKCAIQVANTFNMVLEEMILPISKWAFEDVVPEGLVALTEILRTARNLLEGLTDGISRMWKTIQPVVKWVENTVMVVLGWVNDLLKEIADTIEKYSPMISDIMAGIGDIIMAIWRFVQPVLDFLIELFDPVVKELISVVGLLLGKFIEILAGLVDFVAGLLTGDWERAWDGICTIFGAVWDIISGIVMAALKIIWSVLKEIGGVIYDFLIEPIVVKLQGLWEDIRAIFAPVVNWFNKYVVKPLLKIFTPLWNKISSGASGCWDTINKKWKQSETWYDKNVIKPIEKKFNSMWGGISSKASECWEDIKEFFSPGIKWFEEWFGSIKQTADDIFYNIGEIAKGCWEIIKRAWELAPGWFETNVKEPLKKVFDKAWGDISGYASKSWEDTKTAWNEKKTWFETNVKTPFKEVFDDTWNDIKGYASACWEGVKTVWKNNKPWFETNVKTPFKEAFEDTWAAIKEVFSPVAQFFSDTFGGAWKSIVGKFSSNGEIFVDIKDGVTKSFTKVVNQLITGINKVVKEPFEALNKTLLWLRDLKVLGITPFKGVKAISIPQMPTIELKADGGMVDAGQMFIAREAGPELVGAIGRKTAVVNNQQIIDGIASGVSEANIEQNALLREQNSLLASILAKDNGFYLDGENISKSLDKYNRSRGRVIATGGAY